MSISNYYEDVLLQVLRTLAAGAGVWVKAHIGDPGEAGTANAAAATTRKAITFAAPSGGSMASSNTQTWASVAAAETISHVSLWDSLTVGNHLWYGPLAVPRVLLIGDTLELPTAAVVVGLD